MPLSSCRFGLPLYTFWILLETWFNLFSSCGDGFLCVCLGVGLWMHVVIQWKLWWWYDRGWVRFVSGDVWFCSCVCFFFFKWKIEFWSSCQVEVFGVNVLSFQVHAPSLCKLWLCDSLDSWFLNALLLWVEPWFYFETLYLRMPSLGQFETLWFQYWIRNMNSFFLGSAVKCWVP